MARKLTTLFRNSSEKTPYMTIGYLVLLLGISAIFVTGCSSDGSGEVIPTATPVELEITEPVQTDEVDIATPDKAGNAGDTSVNLKDHYWLLESLGGKQVLEDTYITAELDSQMTGIAGCNEYNAYYEQGYEIFRIRKIIPVEGMCGGPQGVMEQELEYFYLLDRSKTFVVEDGQLKLFNRDGEPNLVFNAVVLGGISTDLSEPLPENAFVKVILMEISSTGTGSSIMAEETMTDQDTSPISFVLPYDPA